MVSDSQLAQSRRKAESRMTETVTARTITESVDPETHATIRTVTATHYAGIALVKYPTLTVSPQQSAGQQFTTADRMIGIPVGAPIIPADAEIRVDTSRVDTSLVGRTFRPTNSPQSGQVTSHRYPVEEIA